MSTHFDHLAFEKEAHELWQKTGVYRLSETNSSLIFSIDTPPPTVSGKLHIGHIFSYTQTDIIARYWRMTGRPVFYPFGFDDNGLPTERFVEKQRGVTAHTLGRSAFIAVCLEETALVEKQFEALWKKVGLSVDWDACYSTIDAERRKISQASFIELYKKDFIYRRDEPALYCTVCRTSVAQAELDDAEKPSHFNDIVFMCEGEKLTVGTTRPELLSSCVALLYHPDDARYQKLAGKKARVPHYDFEVPLIADDLVIPDKGTGLVMCCTFGDKTDVAWFLKHKFSYRPSIGRDGKMLEQSRELAGLKVKDARPKIIEILKSENLLVGQKPITHAVAVHERCKNEIEYLMLPQWFVKILEHKEKFLQLADDINWYPAFMKARYIDWVKNLSWDWGISRQRYFGIPFPVWHCKACGAMAFAEISQLPIDPQEIAYSKPCACGAQDWIADTDVMDTWNTSSLTPYFCASLLNKNSEINEQFWNTEFLPMAMRPQAHDIIRTWAFDTIVKAWMHAGKIPWRDIVISGHVLAPAGEKISKSQGNSPLDPENLLTRFSADAVRYWTATGSLGHDAAFSETQLKIGQKLSTKLWNAFIFVNEHKADYTSSVQPEFFSKKKVSRERMRDPLNIWIGTRATEAFEKYQAAFEKYEYAQALSALDEFFWKSWCDNYLELIKDRFFNPQNYTPEIGTETRETLAAIGLHILQMYAPFMPYITEAIYQKIYAARDGLQSIHNVEFCPPEYELLELGGAVDTVEKLLEIVDIVRKEKTAKQLSLRTEIARLEISGDAELLAQLKDLEATLRGITKAREIAFSAGEFAVQITL